ncbi:MAG: T9SS type A sorting domain-containing protein, partial [Flavobacteriales bacterium]
FTTLKVVNPAFDYNAVGLELSQATAILSCGSVSLNGKYGFLVTDGATVRMDAPSGGTHDPVTAVKNGTTIYCQLANNVYLDLGYNTLYPQYIGTQSALYGTFLCQPYSVPQPARKNNWDGTVGTPLTTADHFITTCGVPLPFFDPSSISPVKCGNVMLLLPGGGTLPTEFSELGILENCPGCSMALTADSVVVPLDQASLAAFNLGNNDSLPSNELLALSAFHSILAATYVGSSTNESQLLNYDHDLMKESYGDALEKGQLASLSTDFFSDSYVDMFSSVQEARAARPDVDDDFIFYTNVERAQVQRAAGRMVEAISILEGLPEPAGEYEQTFKARILCYTQAEAAVHNGTMEWDEVENTMDACLGHGTPKMAAARTDAGSGMLAAGTPYMLPNPASSFVQVQGYMDQGSNLIIMDVMGRSILKEIQVSGKIEVPLGAFSPGIYLCRITGGNGGTWTGRLVIQR